MFKGKKFWHRSSLYDDDDDDDDDDDGNDVHVYDDDNDDNVEDNNSDHISKNFLLNPNFKLIVFIVEPILLVGHQMTKLQNESNIWRKNLEAFSSCLSKNDKSNFYQVSKRGYQHKRMATTN